MKTDVAVETHSWWVNMGVAVSKTGAAVETRGCWVNIGLGASKTGAGKSKCVAGVKKTSVGVSKTGARGYNRSGDVGMVATSPVSVR